MKVFDPFVSKYPPDNNLRKPTAETLEQFQGKVPAELLKFWQEYGFGNYGGGLLKIIDPMIILIRSLFGWVSRRGVSPF